MQNNQQYEVNPTVRSNPHIGNSTNQSFSETPFQSFEYFDANQQLSSEMSKINSNLHMNQSVNSCLQKYPSNPMMSHDYQPNPINFYRRFKKI